MGFAIYGLPVYKIVNEDTIHEFIKLKFIGWLYELNYKYYTNNLYFLDLKISSENENDFIDWELKTLKGLINLIDTFFEYCRLDKYNIDFYKNQYESNGYIHNTNNLKDYIKENKNKNILSVMQKSGAGFDILETLSKEDKLYLLILMYLDFIKIENFLENRIDYKINEIQSENDNKRKPFKWHKIIPSFVNGEISRCFRSNSIEESAKELSKIIIAKLKISLTAEEIRPYIQHTFITPSKSTKDLYSKEKVKVIYDYCKDNEIVIEDEHFLRKIKDFRLE